MATAAILARLSRPYRPWVVWFAPSVAVGAWACAQLADIPDLVWVWMGGGIALLLIGMLVRTRRQAIWMPLGVLVGAGLMFVQMLAWQSSHLPAIWTSAPVTVDVRIDGLAQPTSKGWRVDATIMTAPSPDLVDLPIQLSWSLNQRPLAGDIWTTRLSLLLNDSRHNPAGLDYEAWLFAKGIRATASVSLATLKTPTDQWHWQYWRWLALERLLSVMPADGVFTGLNIALVLGEGAGVSAEQWQVLRDTGTLHLAVVSGMHITLVAGLSAWLALMLWRLRPSERYPAPLVAAIAGAVAAVVFSALSGFGVPVQRALLMLLVIFVAALLRRQLHPLLSLSWELLLVMLWDVSAVLQVGFWLSFLATAVLLWLMASPSHWAWKLLATHIGMSAMMAPALLWSFAQMPTYAPLANLVAAPVIEWLLVPLLLLIAILSWLAPVLAQGLAGWVEHIWSAVWWVLSDMAQWSMAVTLLSLRFEHGLFLLVWGLGLWGLRHRVMTLAGGLWVSLPAMVFPAMAMMVPSVSPQAQLTLLDTGNASMVWVLQHPQGDWLIGTGDQVGKQHIMDQVILPSLTALGVSHLAGVVRLTDEDGAVLGQQKLQQRMSVDQVVSAQGCRSDVPTPWQWQLIGQDCWLSLPSGDASKPIWMTWRSPQQLPLNLTQAMVISPPPTADAQRLARMTPAALWLSARPVSSRWAVKTLGTHCEGAMTVVLSENGGVLQPGYRHRQQRFFHGARQ